MLRSLEPALLTDVEPFDCVQLLCGDDLKVTGKKKTTAAQPGVIASFKIWHKKLDSYKADQTFSTPLLRGKRRAGSSSLSPASAGEAESPGGSGAARRARGNPGPR